jgi:triphosphatase
VVYHLNHYVLSPSSAASLQPGKVMSDSPAPETSRETELKLAVDPETLERLRKAPAILGRAKGRATTKALESVYFDTMGHDLDRRRVTFRVRRAGETFVQTIKTKRANDGLLARDEWEWPVGGPQPDLSVIVEEEPRELLSGIDPVDLRPVFTSVVKRTVRQIHVAGAGIEVAFDVGELRTPEGAVAPISEIEFELRTGEAHALYSVALELAASGPMRVETRSKSARGFALARETLNGPEKGHKPSFGQDTTVEAALCEIVGACLLHLAGNEACALEGRDPEGIHQMRVATRRLRSALALFEAFLPLDTRAWLTDEVRWLGGELGPARDWDVFLEELLAPVRTALDGAGGGAQAEDLDRLRRAAWERREQAYERARAAIHSARYTTLHLRIGAWIERRGWRDQPVSEQSVRLFQPVAGLADALLDRRHRQARKRGRGFARLPAEARHRLRIALKKLRYAVEFFQSLHDDKTARRYVEHLAGLQDRLGHLNDVATAARLLRELHPDGAPQDPAEARAAGIVIGWHARGVIDNEDQLVRRWKTFAGTKPFWSHPPLAE